MTNAKQTQNAQAELKVVETPKMTAVEAMKSNKNFETFMSDAPVAITSELANYPAAENKPVVLIAELTQNKDSFFKIFSSKEYKNKKSLMIVWVVNSVKEEILNAVQLMNERTDNNFGIFVFKADLNDNKMGFECVLKPEMKEEKAKNKTMGNEFNLKYWEKYFEICDSLESDMQVKPNDRAFKTLSSGIPGVQIMLTISKTSGFVASEIYIPDNKAIFDKFALLKDEIEKEVGTLNWLRLENKKAARIVKQYNIDIEDENNLEKAIAEQISMAEELKKVFNKYAKEEQNEQKQQ